MDKTNQTVNLVDLSLQNTRVTQNVTISLEDFEPFVDMKHDSKVIQSAANYTDKTLIINKIKSFQDKIINISKKNNIPSIALTDNNMFATMEFIKKCEGNNIKPIVGLNVLLENFNIILLANIITAKKCAFAQSNRTIF